MKKILGLFLLVLLFSIGNFSKVYADEIDDINEKYALTGTSLEEFEQSEQSRKYARSLRQIDDAEILKDYNLLLSKNDLPVDVSFDEYYTYRNTPEPTDPVSPQFRSVAGRPMAGDMMVTNGTSSSGLTGHAGIFLANGTILSIDGYGNIPRTKTIFEWMRDTKAQNPKAWTKVYRPNSTFYRNLAAGKWGNDNVKGKNIKYGLGGGVLSTNPTYCSKIVMHCYYYANKNGENMVVPSFISPYALPNLFLKGTTHIVTWN